MLWFLLKTKAITTCRGILYSFKIISAVESLEFNIASQAAVKIISLAGCGQFVSATTSLKASVAGLPQTKQSKKRIPNFLELT
jgi:hypothetical protein